MSWIKMTTGLRRHPKVVRMASALRSDKLRVVGGLHAVWCVFDEHSPDGLLEGYTLASMDDEVGWRGFSAAMQSVGWLIESESGLQAPDYEEHNGTTAKRRATDAKRKAAGREADENYGGSWNDVGKMSASDADKERTGSGALSGHPPDEKQTRVELDKRKNLIHPLPPEWESPPGRRTSSVREFPPGFEAFWSAYPRKVGKDAAAKAFAKRKPDAQLLAEMLRALGLQCYSEAWRKDGGQFIPHPSTWLNEGRWQDEQGTQLPPQSPEPDAGAIAAEQTRRMLAEQFRPMTAEEKAAADEARKRAMAALGRMQA